MGECRELGEMRGVGKEASERESVRSRERGEVWGECRELGEAGSRERGWEVGRGMGSRERSWEYKEGGEYGEG